MPAYSLRSFLKSLLPSLLVSLLKSNRHHSIVFEGCFSQWHDALSRSTGYDSEAIFDRVLNSALLVAKGDAEYERDSFIFDRIQYSWPLLAGLLLAAARASGCLNVIDYGGSLGSTFFQNRRFLNHLSCVHWCVIEQPHLVEAGLRFIHHPQLTFSHDLEGCLSSNSPNVAVLSGVLQCIEDPWSILEIVLRAGCDVVILDRTSYVLDGFQERISVQRVPDLIYPASYPCRFFVERVMIEFIESRGYSLVEDFVALDDLDANAAWKGHVFLRS